MFLKQMKKQIEIWSDIINVCEKSETLSGNIRWKMLRRLKPINEAKRNERLLHRLMNLEKIDYIGLYSGSS